MITLKPARTGRGGPSRLAVTETDQVVEELRDLCDRYAGGSPWRERKVQFWWLAKFVGAKAVAIAANTKIDERTVRGHVDDVSLGLRALYGPRVGHPVEQWIF